MEEDTKLMDMTKTGRVEKTTVYCEKCLTKTLHDWNVIIQPEEQKPRKWRKESAGFPCYISTYTCTVCGTSRQVYHARGPGIRSDQQMLGRSKR